MEEKDIRTYAKLMEELDLTGLEIKENGKEIRLERSGNVQDIEVSSHSKNNPVNSNSGKQECGLVDICSPMVGVFYKAISENEKPFVNVGDSVKKGDVLCIIEAMKLMNEITAEYDGVIAEVCVNNKEVVDFGHVLFKIRRNDT